jgi:hypothetical protein
MGSSGDKRRPLDPSLTESPRHAKVLDLRELDMSCACTVDVEANRLLVTVYDQHGHTVESFAVPRKQR